MTKTVALLFCSVILLGAGNHHASGAMTVENLRCEYRNDPLGVDAAQPRLSWELTSAERGQVQTAYQVLIASSREALDRDQGDLWDSGQTKSNQTLGVKYAGKALTSSQQVFWKARTWDRDDSASPWSAVGSWTMGVMSSDDWRGARWIGAPTDLTAATLMFRRQLDVRSGLRRAVVHVCGLGQYEMTLNGKKVGEDLLAPGWTKYDKTCLYDTYDITSMLQPGANSAGLLLGNGMYNVPGNGGRYIKFRGSFGPQRAIALIQLEYSDGAVEHVVTNDQWQVSAGPITFSCVYGGEDYDARLEAGSNWKPAAMIDGPGGALRGLSCAAPPIRAIQTFNATKMRELRPGVSVYDLSQNASFMVRINVKGPAGSSVKIIPAEILKADGAVDRSTSGRGDSFWKYTLRGDEAGETWFTKFFYHGCRYLQVESTGDATVESIEGVVVHSTADPIGEFACSNELFNRIRALVRWAQRSNMVSVLSDCPHRERLGWLEQVYLNGPSLRYEFDLASFFTKTMNDMSDSQSADGLVPGIAPEYVVFKGGFRDSPEWGSAFIQAAWQQYEWTGDDTLLRQHYDNMKRYLMYLDNKSTMGMVVHGLGDWYDVGPKRSGPAQLTPIGLTATAIFYSDTVIMEKVARMLGKERDVREFVNLKQLIKREFTTNMLNDETKLYATSSQTANAMPLVVGLADPDNAQNLIDAIVKDVRQRNNSVTAGDVGYRYLLRALAAGGRSDVIFDMNNQSDRPGYGFQLSKGATSLTEGWAGNGSQNHFMLGHIIEWFYHDLAGIQPDPEGPGFAKIVIKPQVVGDLTWVKASYNSVRGKITSEWKRENGQFTLDVTIPPNTVATVHLPGKAAQPVQQITSGHHTFTHSWE